MTLLDFILIAVVLIGGLLGYKKGFFGSITKPIKFLASISLTILISSPIINAWTRPLFVGKVSAWIEKSILEACAGGSVDISSDKMPVVLKLMAQMVNADVSSLPENATTDEIISLISNQLALPIGNLIAVIVTYLALFILLMILLTVLIALLDTVFTKGVLGKINKGLGVLLGAVVATVTACVIANIVGIFSADAVSGTVTQFFKNINPFSMIMKL